MHQKNYHRFAPNSEYIRRMFVVKIVGKTFNKEMIIDEEKLGKYVPSFVIFQAKKLGKTTTTEVNDGESFTWHIKYQTN